MNPLRAVWRAGRALLHVLGGLWTLRRHFAGYDADGRRQAVQEWSLRLLAVLGVELQVRGRPPVAGPVLLVANHLSWLDIMVMNAASPARFVSKSDVKHWPLLGPLVSASGTLFIERENRRDAMRVVHHMADTLRLGDVVAVFPEGTTGDGRALLPFHANLLQAAISAPAPAQPVALTYLDPRSGLPTDAPLYVGDTTLVASVWRTLSAGGVRAVVDYGECHAVAGHDRRSLAAALSQAIAGQRMAQLDGSPEQVRAACAAQEAAA